MEAIDAAWEAVDRGDPTALRRCIAAMLLARDVLEDIAQLSNVDAEAEPADLESSRTIHEARIDTHLDVGDARAWIEDGVRAPR